MSLLIRNHSTELNSLLIPDHEIKIDPSSTPLRLAIMQIVATDILKPLYTSDIQ